MTYTSGESDRYVRCRLSGYLQPGRLLPATTRRCSGKMLSYRTLFKLLSKHIYVDAGRTLFWMKIIL